MREALLDNGIRVVTERRPDVRSVAVGVWVDQGSAHETPDTAGVSHLMEHLVFKGTEHRTAHEIALSLESP
ncbi:MAG: insulinase family protein, partial [Gemmatimonadetes bacterium]|nr:insulinase family protein [Gemmatimonadota bacterium]